MTRKILGCLWLVVLVVSCKSSQQAIIPITDELVQMEFGELEDLDEEKEAAVETGEEESYMALEPITDKDVRAELDGESSTPAPSPPRQTTSTTGTVPEKEPMNAALLLETGQVVLSDSESSIMLDEVEVVGIIRSTQYPLDPIVPGNISGLKSHGARSAPLVEEVKVKGYSPLKIEDKIFFGEELKVKPLEVKNAQLYAYIKDRLGTPYRKDRMDHLTLMQNLYREVYEVSFPRTTSKAILTNYTEGQIHYTRDMKEGDLLFFRFRDRGRPYTHVGIYLKNKRFLTVTPSGGVEIVNLRDRMWRKGYIGRGRVKNMKQ